MSDTPADSVDRYASLRRPYQLFMLGLSVYALLALAIDVFLPAESVSKRVLEIIDYFVCALFFVDFIVSAATAERRVRYLLTWGWLDLASCIPVFQSARLGRLARILRIAKVMRGIRATKIISTFILGKRAEAAFLAATLVSILLVVCASIGVLHFENGIDGSNIKTADDAVWWAVVTITTVGYGDKFPVTGEGRVIAAILMIAGVGLFGTFSGFVAAWFLAPKNKVGPNELERIRSDLAEIKAALRKGREE
jgi:voltage-gated potassium channel